MNTEISDKVAFQIHKTLEEKFGTMYAFNKDVGSFLTKHFYSTGEYYTWTDRLKHGTGKSLSFDDYCDYYEIK